MMTGKQTDRRPQPQIDIRPRIPRPGGRGIKSSKQIEKSRGEGAGRQEKDDEGTHGHGALTSHHLIRPHRIPSTPPSQPPPHPRSPPAAITSWGKQPPQPYRIGAVPVPRRHPIRSSKAERTTETRQIDHEHGIASKARYAPAAVGMTPSRQASSPAGSPSPDTKSGERRRDDEGRTGKGEARTAGDIADGQASNHPRPMTSRWHHKSGHGTSSEETEPSDEKKSETDDIARQESKQEIAA